MVVIAVIAFMASIALIYIQNSRIKSRDTYRASTLRQISSALELFYLNNGYYPAVFLGDYESSGDWACFDCSDEGIRNKPMLNPNTGEEAYVSIQEALDPYLSTDIQDTYLRTVPGADEGSLADRGYWYTSNGTDYKFGSYYNPEKINNFDAGMIDRDFCNLSNDDPTGCTNSQTAIGIWTPKASTWAR